MNGPRSPLTLLAAALSLAAVAHADEDAGRLFEGRCVNCHTLPDRDLRADRAWIGQVADTA
jgi:cytochrome c2